MAASLEEALKKAYAEKGQELPPKADSIVPGKAIGQGKQHSTNTSSPKQIGTPSMIADPINSAPRPDYELNIAKGSTPTCLINSKRDDYVYVAPAKFGIRTQAHAGTWNDEREVAIGLDFGTSSIKVIIGDNALDKAFAVPFNEGTGIFRYLLPSRLYETAAKFSLKKGRRVYRDLKLSLLADSNDQEAQMRVTALLALVIRHARGWLLSEHRDVYSQTNILWKLAVGLPAAHHLNNEHRRLFEKVSQAAWLAASSIKQKLGRDTVTTALSRVAQLMTGAAITRPAQEIEVSIVPEIAAQIYGYVASNRFDKRAKNLFLMVDVGAGTVDSSLFQVKAGRGGKLGFTFYTSRVQPNGVMNLHRYRMDWWEDAFVKLDGQFKPDTSKFHENKFSTDRMHSIPESYTGYFSDISVQYRDGVKDPDQYFLMRRVVSQVRGETMWRTWEDNLLEQQDLNGVPMFLCGGGSRMQFYRKLEHEMQNFPNYSWLKAETKPLEMPRILIAPGLPVQEYDRLSVAFGLSFLEVSEVIKATPIPEIIPDQVTSWGDNYIGKDQC